MSGLVQDGALGHGDLKGHDGAQWGRGKPQGHGQDALVHGGYGHGGVGHDHDVEGQESGAQGVEEGPGRCGVEQGGEVPGNVIDQF